MYGNSVRWRRTVASVIRAEGTISAARPSVGVREGRLLRCQVMNNFRSLCVGHPSKNKWCSNMFNIAAHAARLAVQQYNIIVVLNSIQKSFEPLHRIFIGEAMLVTNVGALTGMAETKSRMPITCKTEKDNKLLTTAAHVVLEHEPTHTGKMPSCVAHGFVSTSVPAPQWTGMWNTTHSGSHTHTHTPLNKTQQWQKAK